MQLHAWDAENHPNLVNADAAPTGHGVVNPAPRRREIWLRNPNGYVVALAGPDGECDPCGVTGRQQTPLFRKAP